MSVGAEVIARELRANADILEVRERGDDNVAGIAPQLTTSQWRDFRGQTDRLRTEDPKLWAEVIDAYDALDETKRRRTMPPTAVLLRRLAKRLDRKVIHHD